MLTEFIFASLALAASPTPAPTPVVSATAPQEASSLDANLATLAFKGESFEKLKTAARKFREARLANELDRSRPNAEALKLREQQDLEQGFFDQLQQFSGKRVPRFDLKKENKSMNIAFKKIMANKEKAPWGTVTKDGVLKTQKAWVEYRNAWKQFAKSEKGDTDQIDAWFTSQRTSMLKSILGER